MAASLVRQYAWSTRTESTRNSQWLAWVEFCEQEGRPLLPATEAHFVAYVGWLMGERIAERRSVSSRSLPQYFSAVRTMHSTLLGTAVPDFPFLPMVVRAYTKWEEEAFPQPTVRLGVPATMMQQVWSLGMSSESPSLVRDCAMLTFSYCMNGLRESSVLSILAGNVTLETDRVTARLSVMKGREASGVQLVSYSRLVPGVGSPLDLWKRWAECRGSHPRFFALAGEPTRWTSGKLNLATKTCLTAIGMSAPTGGKYTSHSCRIGSHTEQILLGFPLEVRLERFGWGPRSQEMAALYFDRTIKTTAASFWFFGVATPPAPHTVAIPVTLG